MGARSPVAEPARLRRRGEDLLSQAGRATPAPHRLRGATGLPRPSIPGLPDIARMRGRIRGGRGAHAAEALEPCVYRDAPSHSPARPSRMASRMAVGFGAVA